MKLQFPPLKPKGVEEEPEDPLHTAYKVTKVSLGSGADGGVQRAIHRSTGDRCPNPVGTASSFRTAPPPPSSNSSVLRVCSLVPRAVRRGRWREGLKNDGLRRRPDSGHGSGKPCALKYISRDAYGGHEREVKILEGFKQKPHPNLLHLIEAFGPQPCRPQWVLVTAEADTNLRWFMIRHAEELSQSPDHRIQRDIGTQMLRGMQHMHRHRIIHRDLKPDNVLIYLQVPPAPPREGHFWALRVVLADFSRARMLPADVASAVSVRYKQKARERQTAAAMSTRVGTFNYTPPELASKHADDVADYGTYVDMWAFGCVYFELLRDESFAPGQNLTNIMAYWHVRLGPMPQEVADELGIATDQVRSAADAIKARDPEVVVSSLIIQIEPWLSSTLVYVGSKRSTTTTLLAEAASAGAGASGDDATGPSSPKGRRSVGSTPSTSSARLDKASQPLSSWSSAAHETVGLRIGEVLSQVPLVQGVCQCSGNCSYRNVHRKDTVAATGCRNELVHPANRLCKDCTCKVSDCMRAATKSGMCCMHDRIYNMCSEPLRASICMGDLACYLMPADVTDLRRHVAKQSLREDLASLVLVAMIKEPSVTKAFVESGCHDAMVRGDSSDDVAQRFWEILGKDDLQVASECSELGAQGVCRATGCATTFKLLGLIELFDGNRDIRPAHSGSRRRRGDAAAAADSSCSKRPKLGSASPSTPTGKAAPAEADDERVYRLGATRRPYRKTGDTSKLNAFMSECRELQPTWLDILRDADLASVVKKVDALVSTLRVKTSALPSDANAYTPKFVARKLVLVCFWEGRLSDATWRRLTVRDLMAICPDQSNFFAPIPPHWSCEELSNFVFGRPDMALYASMYACLWKDVRATSKKKWGAILDALSGGRESAVGQMARQKFYSLGHQCTPKTIVKTLVEIGAI